LSDLESVCHALEDSMQPLPALVESLRQRAARLRAIAAEVENAARRVSNGPNASRVVQGLHEAAAAMDASGHALMGAVQRSQMFVTRTIGGAGGASNASVTTGSIGRAGASTDQSYLGGTSNGSGRATADTAPSPPGQGFCAEIAGGDGIREVPISQIDTSDREITEGDFGKGYSPDDLKWALNALEEVVLPALAAGHGRDYFAGRDAAEGRMGTRSYSDTYSGFFSDDNAIRLAWSEGRYHVENGYHRIWLARQTGRSHVPARVVG